jgi:putative chitinase
MFFNEVIKMTTVIDTIINTVRTEGTKMGWSKTEMAAFLAQAEHESASFTRTKEMGYRPERAYQLFPKRFGSLANAKAIYAKSGASGLFEVMYTGKIGNDKPGDGAKYIGRGYIQITGKGNYQLVKKETGVDVIAKPELLEQPEFATLASMVWWQENVHKRIDNFSSTQAVTRIVNGPALLGLPDRVKKFEKWVKII